MLEINTLDMLTNQHTRHDKIQYTKHAKNQHPPLQPPHPMEPEPKGRPSDKHEPRQRRPADRLLGPRAARHQPVLPVPVHLPAKVGEEQPDQAEGPGRYRIKWVRQST